MNTENLDRIFFNVYVEYFNPLRASSYQQDMDRGEAFTWLSMMDDEFENHFNKIEDEIVKESKTLSNLDSSTYYNLKPTINEALLKIKLSRYHITKRSPTENFTQSPEEQDRISDFYDRLNTEKTFEFDLFSLCVQSYRLFLERVFLAVVERALSIKVISTPLEGLFPNPKLYTEFIQTLLQMGWIDKQMNWISSYAIYLTPLIQFLKDENLLNTKVVKKIALAFEKSFHTGRNAESMRKYVNNRDERYQFVARKFSFLKG